MRPSLRHLYGLGGSDSGGAAIIAPYGLLVGRSRSGGYAQFAPIPRPYTQTMLDLLPSGIAWPRELTTELAGICEALGIEPARVDRRCADLVDNFLPDEADEMIGEWEAFVGLPVPSATTLDQREANCLYWLTMPGRQDAAFWIALALLSDYAITITNYEQATADSACNAPLTQTPWQYQWDVSGASQGADADALLTALFGRLAAEQTSVAFFLA